MRRVHALALLVALASACVKPHPPVVAARPVPVAVAPVRTDFATNDAVAVPERLREAVADAIGRRNLTPRVVPEAELAARFGDNRNARSRLEQLAAWDTSNRLLVLLETESSYYAQVAGRYRWVVNVRITFSPRDDLDAALVRSFEVPVFMQFYHEREDATVAEATPTIARRLGELLDEYLAAHPEG